MKRAFFVAIMMVCLGAVMSPLGSMAVTDTAGDLAPDPSALKNAVNPRNYVCIGLPVIGTLPKCSAAEGGGLKISNNKADGGAIIVYLRAVLQLMSMAVGAVVLLMIVIAGVQYITSTADPGRVKAAKDRLQNALIALVLYLMMYAILTLLVPGGIL